MFCSQELAKKRGIEARFKKYADTRQWAAATLAVARMKKAGLKEALSEWSLSTVVERQMNMVGKRIAARMVYSKLAAAMDSWVDFKEQSKLEAKSEENTCIGSPQDSPGKTKFVSY